jgi:DNA-directed RNA polymerase subunit RPC12/RpoP
MNENAFLKTTCPHCGIHVEYPTEAEGEVAPCPKCGSNVLLKNWVEGVANRERMALKQVLPQSAATPATGYLNGELSLIGRVVIGIFIGTFFAIGIGVACLLASKMGWDGLGGFMWWCRFRIMDLGIWMVLLLAFIPVFTFSQRKQNQTYKDALREDAMGSCVSIAFVSLFLLTFPFFYAQPHQSQPVPKPVALAQESLKSKAEGGDADAQFKFGSAYFDGVGVAKDLAEAAIWWRKAAEQNNDSAQYGLGVCYYFGFGVTKNGAEAVNWWRKAAEQGNAPAQYFLGVKYDAGEGVGRMM